MLDQRPLLQRTVYASGAFALVFSAAMAGSAIMITGGLFPGHLRVSSASADTPQQSLWSAPALGESAPPYVYDAAQTYAAQTPSAPLLHTWLPPSGSGPPQALKPPHLQLPPQVRVWVPQLPHARLSVAPGLHSHWLPARMT